MQNSITIAARDLSVGYHDKTLIPDLNFDVKAGEILALIGPNGAGKSTILKTLSARLHAISGAVILDGTDLKSISGTDLSRKQSVLMTDRPSVELFTVKDMVSMGRYPYTGFLGTLKPEDHEIVKEAMDIVGITDLKDCDFMKISDGQKQLTLLAKAICQKPDILIMDEPASYLDINHKLSFISIIRTLARTAGIAVIISLHELDLAIRLADSVLCIASGKVDRYGTVDEVFSQNDRYIEKLYGLSGSFNSLFGCIETEKIIASPKVFVIGGGQSAISLYRKLQKDGTSFYAGILQENDVAYSVAVSLAIEVVFVPAYEDIDEETMLKAKDLLKSCERAVLVKNSIGSTNSQLNHLADYAKSIGKLEVL